jgi:GNAT superfamily N-acetyltransferase
MGNDEVRVVCEAAVPADAVLEAIKRELREFNRAANPEYWALRGLPENEPQPLHVVAYDASGAVAGGLIATTCFAWLDIDIMSVREKDRRRGIGRRLVAAAEKEALRRGCRYASVDTMSFQAPTFYEQLGYEVAGTFADRDGHGHTKYFFTKTLGRDGPRAAERAPVTIVRAGPERRALAEHAVRAVHGRAEIDDAALAAYVADPACVLLAAVAEGRAVGSVNGYALRHPHRRESQFLLYELDVVPEWRGRGVGTALVGAFTDTARDAGASEVWVLTNASNAAAMAAYRRCGLRRIHGDDAMLRLALAPPRAPEA